MRALLSFMDLAGGTRKAALLAGVCLALAASVAPAKADKVGVAAAVEPDAFSSLSGTPNKQLNIGKSIFYNERINTTASGLVQVLLVDGSTFTVGPNSDLVIDKFVYDPNKKSGALVATFSKGTMRFIGGKLSKNEGGVKVNTPAGALAIRGGMFQAQLSGRRGIFSFLYGDYLRLGNHTAFEHGYTIDTTGGTVRIRPTTRADINAILVALTNRNSNWHFGNSQTDNPSLNERNFFQNHGNPDELIDTATQDQIQSELQKEFINRLKNVPPPGTSGPGTEPGGEPGTEPDTRAGGIFNGYASGFIFTKGAPGFVGNLSPDEVSLELTPSTDTVSASINLRELDPTKLLALLVDSYFGTQYELAYQGIGSDAYPSDQSFSADAQAATVTKTSLETSWFPPFIWTETHTSNPDITGSFVTSDLVEGNPRPGGLCDNCDFIKFGTWGAELTSQHGESQQASQAFLGGWWVAGEITQAADLPTEGSASYAGSAVGYATTKSHGTWSAPYVASGDMAMNWDFGTRKGDLSITNFDGRSFSGNLCGAGLLCPTGKNHFVGTLSGADRIKGSAAGSFVNAGGDKIGGVIGNFGVGNNKWQGAGIFGGRKIP